MNNILEGIRSPEDIKRLNILQLQQLSSEVREFLIESVSKTGGHLASNLGVVELTIALHFVFDSPKDKIIWDVGHQSYVHKIITGRRDRFGTIRKFDGISGFPKGGESVHDAFDTGHSSTSVSAALGLARARDILGERHSVISVIGDGALTGGMSFEALNDAGRSPNNLIVILNDNDYSIRKNIGGLSRHLIRVRAEPAYFKIKEGVEHTFVRIPGAGKFFVTALNNVKDLIKYTLMRRTIFEELGFKYYGPIDGHDLHDLIDILSKARLMKGPVFVHVCTQKGKGYRHAEENPHVFHGIAPFKIETGETIKNNSISFSDVFGQKMLRLAERERTLAAITAAMPDGTGLTEFSKRYPERFFDVGIAEQHAVTCAAGMAKNGLKPVFAVYSSFLQRAYDQIIHDVALQNLHVIFAIDRAGIVGEDGETHQGIYDLSFLGHIPNMAVLAPCDYKELEGMLEYAVMEHKGPIAIRYPRGEGKVRLLNTDEPVIWHKGLKICEGDDVTIVSAGSMVEAALRAAAELREKGIGADLINARFVKPLDEEMIIGSSIKTRKVVTVEDNSIMGGLGSGVSGILSQNGVSVRMKMLGFPDKFVKQGARSELFRKYRLDPDSLADEISRFVKE